MADKKPSDGGKGGGPGFGGDKKQAGGPGGTKPAQGGKGGGKK